MQTDMYSLTPNLLHKLWKGYLELWTSCKPTQVDSSDVTFQKKEP